MGLLLRVEKGSDLTPAEADDLFADTYTQAAHGITIYQAVYRTSGGVWATALATAESTLADGLSTFINGANTLMVMTIFGQQLSIGVHGFTIGNALYLSQVTPGALQDTAPADGWIQRAGKVISTTEIIWRPESTRPAEFV